MVFLVHIVYRIPSQDAYHVLSDTQASFTFAPGGSFKGALCKTFRFKIEDNNQEFEEKKSVHVFPKTSLYCSADASTHVRMLTS